LNAAPRVKYHPVARQGAEIVNCTLRAERAGREEAVAPQAQDCGNPAVLPRARSEGSEPSEERGEL
jgi:hypothetical protein